MKRRTAILLSLAYLFVPRLLVAQEAAPIDPAHIYGERCAACHGQDRLGGQGPALIPEALVRLRREAAVRVIGKGRAATQMMGFEDQLSGRQIEALAGYIYSPLAKPPKWSVADIEASRVLGPPAPELAVPTFQADPLNLFVVVEAGDHHVTILDGDRFEPIHRFQSRFALHGGPKFTRDGRFVFFASRDGWVTKFDLWTLRTVAEARAGLNTRNIALSADGRHVAVANYLPHTLVVLAAQDLAVEKVFDVADRKGVGSRVSAVYQAPTRASFIAALKDVPEIWEISTDPNAPAVYSSLVHSHEKGAEEALPSAQGLFALRRIEVDDPLDDFFFDPRYRHLLGSSRDGKRTVVVNLNVGRAIAHIDIPGLPHLGSGISWVMTEGERKGHRVVAMPHLREGKISIVDMTEWTLIKHVATPGPGFFLRSHEGSRFAWADVMLGASKDQILILDKETLEVSRTLTPWAGKTAAHVEFDRYGKHALVSVWENPGAIVVYDAASFAEVKRIPMAKPSGKYNVHNKITFSEGTSH
ncbi:MAG: cytochrome C oxidase Cbb3 [Hyphomicrobiales bacterium]|nr:MAG: cytochrome C oxidase Cbb3 [Hyphomicrobiales bacterium]